MHAVTSLSHRALLEKSIRYASRTVLNRPLLLLAESTAQRPTESLLLLLLLLCYCYKRMVLYTIHVVYCVLSNPEQCVHCYVERPSTYPAALLQLRELCTLDLNFADAQESAVKN
eukprot:18249-Heterococcus_DN1.PRE.1